MSISGDYHFPGTTLIQDLYIYGSFNYDITGDGSKWTFQDVDIQGNLEVSGISSFFGPVNFYDSVNFDHLQVGIITVTKRIDVGAAGTVFVGIVSGPGAGNVGIGTSIPEQSLDVAGSIKVDEHIYDSANSSGVNGYYLNRDAAGIRWVSASPDALEGIFVQDHGTYIPVAGVAQTFTTLNFRENNSLGIGTTSIIPIPNPNNSTMIADIESYDLWGYTSGENIYRMSNVGINNNSPSTTLDVTGTLHVSAAVDFDSTLNVDGNTSLRGNLTVDESTILEKTLNAKGNVDFDSDLNVDADTTMGGTLTVEGATLINDTFRATGTGNFDATLNVDGDTTLQKQLIVGAASTFNTSIEVKETSHFKGTARFDSSILDINQNTGVGICKTDWRLSSVGTGVSWRPSGVETKNAIWVSVNGCDTNSGLLEGDSKRTIGAAATVAQEGDTIIVRSGYYYENNPIGLRTDVSVSGEDLRLVTVVPSNRTKDVFHVRRGCLIQNINFSGPHDDNQGGVTYAHTGGGAVAFPPLDVSDQANTGYIALGPANEGKTGRYKSPYVRNCTNFMTGSIGMKIDGNHVNAAFDGVNDLGQDIKSMVCDSFTQYNESGIGVSITNNGYAQLVSIFTIGCDKAIYCDTGGQCDLTNSNSSFGNYGLFADGVGAIEFEGQTQLDEAAENDIFEINAVTDSFNNKRKPFDGQCLWFKINLSAYNDINATGYLSAPLNTIRSIKVTNGGTPGTYSQTAPPSVRVSSPEGPEAIRAELSVNVSAAGTITSVDVINSGRNFLPTQTVSLTPSSGNAVLEPEFDPIYYTVAVASDAAGHTTGLSTVTLNEFVPYAVGAGTSVEFKRISRIITSSHSFEYVGAGTDLNTANPFQGGEPLPANEIVAINGGQVPFTSTDQQGNFRIGEGLVIDQTTSTIRGRDFNRAIQAQLTPLILALR